MTEVLTSAQMRGIEQAAMTAGLATGLELMERAGAAVAQAILAEWPALGQGGRVVVLCGPGNNGGDGFVVARLLAQAGLAVVCVLMGDEGRLPPDAAEMCRRWQAIGGGITPWPAYDPRRVPADVVVDALFGIGMSRPLILTPPQDAIMVLAPRVVAVDVPTGLLADTGHVIAPGFRADLTVTFHAPKLGHLLHAGPAMCGRLVVADIGLPRDAAEPGMDRVSLVAPPFAGLAKGGGHKFDHGHALVLAGGPGRGGAARLAARAALRIGAGLVTVAAPPLALAENAARLDAVMLRSLQDSLALKEVLQDRRIRALCLGPGLGLAAREVALVAAALAEKRLVVLDADALTLVAGDASLFEILHGGCVLTPHAGEFARLFPDLAAQMQAEDGAAPALSKVDAVRQAAARAGCVVLLKGADTVIAGPSGPVALHAAIGARAVPWLATAGAGDVLAGFITGLMARGLTPFDAACAAVWLHVDCARQFGPGLIAEDLPDMLPKVLRDLGV